MASRIFYPIFVFSWDCFTLASGKNKGKLLFQNAFEQTLWGNDGSTTACRPKCVLVKQHCRNCVKGFDEVDGF
jgi:hypothetical protein